MKRRGDGKKKRKKKEKKRIRSVGRKNDIFPIGEKSVLRVIHRVSRASHGSVVCSLRTIYVVSYPLWGTR